MRSPMNRDTSISLAGRARSFRSALAGIHVLVGSQRNAWIHVAATVAVVALGLYLGLSAAQWAIVTVAVASVWTAEAVNTAFELLADAVAPEFNPLIGKAKDVAAGAVLIAAIGAVAIGLLVFVPEIADRMAH